MAHATSNVTNGGTLEDCHTNIFVLTELNGLKWCRFTADASHEFTDVREDQILNAYSQCLTQGLLCVWRRVPSAANQNSTSSHGFHGAVGGRTDFRLNAEKELQVFWYGEEPDWKKLDAGSLTRNGEGSWETGIEYETRTLLFKALHNLIERCLLTSGYVRLGRWFVRPLSSDGGIDVAKNPYLLAFSLSFFVHGEINVCVCVDVQKQPPLYKLPSLGEAGIVSTGTSAQQKLGFFVGKREVILAPWSIKGFVNFDELWNVRRIQNENADRERDILREWSKFYPIQQIVNQSDPSFFDHRSINNDDGDENVDSKCNVDGHATLDVDALPKKRRFVDSQCGRDDPTSHRRRQASPLVVDVTVGGVKVPYPSRYVLLAPERTTASATGQQLAPIFKSSSATVMKRTTTFDSSSSAIVASAPLAATARNLSSRLQKRVVERIEEELTLGINVAVEEPVIQEVWNFAESSNVLLSPSFCSKKDTCRCPSTLDSPQQGSCSAPHFGGYSQSMVGRQQTHTHTQVPNKAQLKFGMVRQLDKQSRLAKCGLFHKRTTNYSQDKLQAFHARHQNGIGYATASSTQLATTRPPLAPINTAVPSSTYGTVDDHSASIQMISPVASVNVFGGGLMSTMGVEGGISLTASTTAPPSLRNARLKNIDVEDDVGGTSSVLVVDDEDVTTTSWGAPRGLRQLLDRRRRASRTKRRKLDAGIIQETPFELLASVDDSLDCASLYGNAAAVVGGNFSMNRSCNLSPQQISPSHIGQILQYATDLDCRSKKFRLWSSGTEHLTESVAPSLSKNDDDAVANDFASSVYGHEVASSPFSGRLAPFHAGSGLDDSTFEPGDQRNGIPSNDPYPPEFTSNLSAPALTSEQQKKQQLLHNAGARNSAAELPDNFMADSSGNSDSEDDHATFLSPPPSHGQDDEVIIRKTRPIYASSFTSTNTSLMHQQISQVHDGQQSHKRTNNLSGATACHAMPAAILDYGIIYPTPPSVDGATQFSPEATSAPCASEPSHYLAHTDKPLAPFGFQSTPAVLSRVVQSPVTVPFLCTGKFGPLPETIQHQVPMRAIKSTSSSFGALEYQPHLSTSFVGNRRRHPHDPMVCRATTMEHFDSTGAAPITSSTNRSGPLIGNQFNVSSSLHFASPLFGPGPSSSSSHFHPGTHQAACFSSPPLPRGSVFGVMPPPPYYGTGRHPSGNGPAPHMMGSCGLAVGPMGYGPTSGSFGPFGGFGSPPMRMGPFGAAEQSPMTAHNISMQGIHSPVTNSGPFSVRTPRTPGNLDLQSPPSNASSHYTCRNLGSMEVGGVGSSVYGGFSPEAHGLYFSLLLCDSFLDVHKDCVFDSCPICVCCMSIKGSSTESNLYVVSPPSCPPSNQSGGGVDSAQQWSTAKCSCGFSAVRNRYLSYKAGQFYEDECEVTNIWPSTVGKSLGLHDITGSTSNATSSDADLSLAGKFSAEIIELIRFYSLTADLTKTLTVSGKFKANCRLVPHKQYNVASDFVDSSATIKRSTTRGSAVTGAATNESETTAFLYQHAQLEMWDFAELCNAALEQASLLGDCTTPSRADLTKGKSALVNSWAFLKARKSVSSLEAMSLIRNLLPTLQESVQKPRGVWQSKHSVEGPLTWRQFHRKCVHRPSGREDFACAGPEPVPLLLAGCDREWVTVSPFALRFWDRLSLEPFGQTKDVAYVVVLPDNPHILLKAKGFFKQLGKTYEAMRLGRHAPITSVLKDGLMRVGKTHAGHLGNKPVDPWFDQVNVQQQDHTPPGRAESHKSSSSPCFTASQQFKLYAQVCRHYLAPHLADNVFDRSVFNSRDQQVKDPAVPSHVGSQSGMAADFSMPPPAVPSPTSGGPNADCGQESVYSDVNNADNCWDPNSADFVPPVPHCVVVYLVNSFTYGADSAEKSSGDRLACSALFRCFLEILKDLPDSAKIHLQMQIVPLQAILESAYPSETPDVPIVDGEDITDALAVQPQAPKFSLSQSDYMRQLSLDIFSQSRTVGAQFLLAFQAKPLTTIGPAASRIEVIKRRVDRSAAYQLHCPLVILAAPSHDQAPLHTAASHPLPLGSGCGAASAAGDESSVARVLFVTYCPSGAGQRWLLATATDQQGALLDNCVIDLNVPNRWCTSRRVVICEALKKVWEFICGLLATSCQPWRLVIGRLGRIGHEELKAWAHLLNKGHLRATSRQLRDHCPVCHSMPGLQETPCVLSACLISTEADANFRVFADSFTYDERFGQCAKQCPLSTPEDASCTHIMVFPTSALIQINQMGVVSTSGIGQMDDIDEFENMNWDIPEGIDDGNLNDLLCDGSFEAGTMQNRISDAPDDSIQQQPLALGFIVSTAPLDFAPEFFWSYCPSAQFTTPVHLRSSLHINTSAVQQNDDQFLTAAGNKCGSVGHSHALDSTLTTDVLRYALETYNALSWLSIDPSTGDRRSCLPIHMQALCRLYKTLQKLL